MAEMTPMMKQYLEIKEKHKDYILFFRLGDFYEMFFDDAKLASKELELTLTGRDCGQQERAPMCGVPYHSCEGYIARLISKGYKVAICEQTEDPAKAKGLVKREIVRIITPGTITDAIMLDEAKNNFLSSVYFDENGTGLCFADISTGEAYATFLDNNDSSKIINELGKYAPREVLLCESACSDKIITSFLKDRLNCTITELDDKYFIYDECIERINKHFSKSEIIKNAEEISQNPAIAIGALLKYLYETQFTDMSHLNNLNVYTQAQYMELDLTTRRNLELTETMRNKEKKGSLLGVLDKTKTAMGSRHLRNYIEHPLINSVLINKRLNAVAQLKENFIKRQEIMSALSNVYDIERLMTKVIYASANGRDLRSLSSTIENIPQIKDAMNDFGSEMLKKIYSNLDPLDDIKNLINTAIVDDPPFTIREGGIIKNGYNSEVDELRSIMNDGQSWISKMELKEKEKTGIKNLKIGFNKVFGYFIEVTKSYLNLVPQDYIRKQTLSNCERYITQDLKDMENKILSAREKITRIEYELFCQVRNKISENLHRIQKTAQCLSELDVLCSLAHVAEKNNYVMPLVDMSDTIEIKDGRHPVVENMLSNSLFVPNDTLLDEDENTLAIITGPNMAGKSTYMRQVALITLMAQIGSFVPAKSAKIGIVDKIFTRVGASDDLASGQSTFMVEMSEVATILKNATKKSLLIFDEIGRGTSTYDGMAIARAVLEYVANKKRLGAKSLFATHYHELTELENALDGVKNYNIAVKKRGDDITFLRKIVRGGADDSYGIEVAKLAGIPDEVINRAKVILKKLSDSSVSNKHIEKTDNNDLQSDNTAQEISLLDSMNSEIVDELKNIDINVLTPIEAMNKLFSLIKKSKEL